MDIEIFNNEIYKGSSRRLRESFIKKNYIIFYEYINNHYLGKSFLEKIYNYSNGRKEENLCYCGQKTKFISFTKGYLKFCSTKCSSNNDQVRSKYRDTNLKKYGVENPSNSPIVKKKKKETSFKNYGVEHPMLSKLIKSKIDKTILDKYGVINVFQSDEIKKKIKETNLIKYGVDHNSKSEIVTEKRKVTNMRRYGYSSFFKTPQFKENMKEVRFNEISDNIKKYSSEYKLTEINNNSYTLTHSKCGETFEIQPQLVRLRSNNNVEICKKCNPFNKNYSKSELEIQKFLSDHNITHESNDRSVLDGKELDIYIPSKNLAIEFNGLYWHSELFLDKKYHLNKTDKCDEQSINLFHVWEDQWSYNKDIIKSMILNKIGQSPNIIYARNTEIREITYTKSVSKFLDENHLQGKVGSKIKLGLFHDGELVSLMTFGSLRKNLGNDSKENHYELMRFCNKKYTSVIGGASKLFKYFIKMYNPLNVISYAPRDHSNSNLYEKLGFKLLHKTPPNYYYIKNNIRYNRFKFRKDILITEGYNRNKTEREIMTQRGYYRIYDSGSYKYEF